jgi:hypothetical protein
MSEREFGSPIDLSQFGIDSTQGANCACRCDVCRRIRDAAPTPRRRVVGRMSTDRPIKADNAWHTLSLSVPTTNLCDGDRVCVEYDARTNELRIVSEQG